MKTHRRTARIAAMLLAVCTVLMTMPGAAALAAAPAGIAGNGTGGVYIDVNADPYTYYAQMPTWGQYAYTREGCAWYATSRTAELTGQRISQIYSGVNWYNSQYSRYGFSRGSQIREKSLACYSGHVSVVEKIEGDRVLVSEGGMAGYSGAENGYTVLRWRDISEMGSVSSSQPDTLLGYVYLTAADTEAPSISNIRVTDVTRDGYTVSCTVTDHTGVAWVQFPTYYPGESEAVWLTGSVYGNEASVRVSADREGWYITQIYAGDAAGNIGRSEGAEEIWIDRTGSVITNIRVENVTSEGYTIGCDIIEDGASAPAGVYFVTWTERNGQDDLDPDWTRYGAEAVQTGDHTYHAQFQVDRGEYDGEYGLYNTLIYVCDTAGNWSAAGVSGIWVREDNGLPFWDIMSSDWYYDAVQYVYDRGIMTGMDENTFAPDSAVARAQLALMLHRMEGTPETENENLFPDVSEGDWYAEAVQWASEAGIVTGYSNGRFGPADSVTREQLAAMLYRYAGYLGLDTSVSAPYDQYLDAAGVQDFAKEAMGWAVGAGIISGKYDQTILDPQGNATRAECATMIRRFLEGAA